MALYRYIITPLSAQSTPWQSDTLYGHLLCAAREFQGPAYLTRLLDAFRAGEPPFVLSSAFPRGMLPKPVLAPMSRANFKSLAEGLVVPGGLFQAMSKYKEFRKRPWLPVDVWPSVRDKLSSRVLFQLWLKGQSRNRATPDATQAMEMHNTIDRRTGRGLDGRLYTTTSVYHHATSRMDIYVQTENPEQFEVLLSHVALQGLGKDRSSGKGAFSFVLDPDFRPQDLIGSSGAWKLSLSVLSARNLHGLRGHYATLTKYGKVWNGFGQSNPFKKPFLALTEGATLSWLPALNHVLTDIHADPAIVQITLPLCIPCSVEEEA